MQHFTPPASLGDGDVSLRPWRETDTEALVRRLDDPEVATFLDRIPQPYTRADALAWIDACSAAWADGSASPFAIVVAGFEGPVGGLGIHWQELSEGVAEVGYWVAAEARGRGVASAATRAAAKWAFAAAPELERLQLRADVDNIASNRVAEKSGFTREGVLRAQRYNARLGRRVDFVLWSLLREEL